MLIYICVCVQTFLTFVLLLGWYCKYLATGVVQTIALVSQVLLQLPCPKSQAHRESSPHSCVVIPRAQHAIGSISISSKYDSTLTRQLNISSSKLCVASAVPSFARGTAWTYVALVSSFSLLSHGPLQTLPQFVHFAVDGHLSPLFCNCEVVLNFLAPVSLPGSSITVRSCICTFTFTSCEMLALVQALTGWTAFLLLPVLPTLGIITCTYLSFSWVKLSSTPVSLAIFSCLSAIWLPTSMKCLVICFTFILLN